MDTVPAAGSARPLVVDLDGTLIRTDVLLEGWFALMASRPAAALTALAALLGGGRAAFKARVAETGAAQISTLPFNQELLEVLRQEKARGRPLYLASAADAREAHRIADHLGLFDGVFASDGRVNLKGAAKAAALSRAFGERGFDYAGNEAADLPVWRVAARAVVVNASPVVIRAVKAACPETLVLTPKTLDAEVLVSLITLFEREPPLSDHAI